MIYLKIYLLILVAALVVTVIGLSKMIRERENALKNIELFEHRARVLSLNEVKLREEIYRLEERMCELSVEVSMLELNKSLIPLRVEKLDKRVSELESKKVLSDDGVEIELPIKAEVSN